MPQREWRCGSSRSRATGNNVGRPHLQAFYGAVSGLRAQFGVHITSSDYTKEAREFAASVSDSIVLVNGEKLARLMIQYGIGVSREERRLPRIDSDFFEDDA